MRLVLSLERVFKRALSKAKSKLQQSLINISSRVKGITAITSLEKETTDSKKAFYLFSLMLLISLILAPDKIPQALTPFQGDTEFFIRVQEIIKKLTPSLS